VQKRKSPSEFQGGPLASCLLAAMLVACSPANSAAPRVLLNSEQFYVEQRGELIELQSPPANKLLVNAALFCREQESVVSFWDRAAQAALAIIGVIQWSC